MLTQAHSRAFHGEPCFALLSTIHTEKPEVVCPGLLELSRAAPGLLHAFNLIDFSDTHQTLTLYGMPLEKISLFHSATGLIGIQKQSYLSGYENQKQNLRVGWVDLVG